MNLNINRLWHLEEGEMFYKPKFQDMIDVRSGINYITCFDVNGKERSFPFSDKILDIHYATTMVDDSNIEIITGDVIEVDFVFGNKHRVAIVKHKIGRDTIFDFHPQILSPSLGIAYLLSRNVKSIKIIGHMYEDHSKVGGLG